VPLPDLAAVVPAAVREELTEPAAKTTPVPEPDGSGVDETACAGKESPRNAVGSEAASTAAPEWKSASEEHKNADADGAEERRNVVQSKEIAQTIRVDLKRLDKLINLVGELVIAESMVFRELNVVLDNDNDLEHKIHHLQRVSSELQDVAMSVRMVSLDATFKKMIRLIHDLSRKSGKAVNMKIVGEETEVDKNVIEQINDPIVHIIRNSVDHGIEAAAERLAAGKPEAGLVTLEAWHDGGEVWISISDDGRGLDREKIIAKGIATGMIAGDGTDLTDDEVFQLIFEPGFSTAEKVTDISGRGVGMDVVKKNIEKLNGRIRIRSNPGQGTTISLRIPLTLAIIDGMLVKIGTGLFTIPLLSIKESLRCGRDMVTTLPDGNECVAVREEQIPVMRLYKCFNRTTDIKEIDQGVLVIVEADGEKAALLVDEIVGQQEIVIKGLSGYLGTPNGISGCTVLGNGEVSLIIDTSSLLSRGKV
ncbi:MAG: chemotaxis protein CheA, partial [Victivallales bacterium]|nr:chemotaxis protein CheA [Victivallales bacterium]